MRTSIQTGLDGPPLPRALRLAANSQFVYVICYAVGSPARKNWPFGTMLPTKKLQVLLVDADLSTRNIARTQIRKHPGWTVLAETDTVARALELARIRRPDVVILDHALATEGRTSAVPRIVAAAPTARLVVLISNPSEGAIREDLRAGAMAFLLKSECKNRLATAIKQVALGQRFFSGQISRIILRRFLFPSRSLEDHASVPDGLTPRELEIIRLITLGNGNKQVAAQLGIAVRTAETHRSNLMRKLNLHNLAEVVNYALVRGLI